MAADPAISERIYQELRRRLLTGSFRLRQRLDVGRIATEMRASATPVREALNRLAIEGLIVARPTKGFFATLWTEAELIALYEWRGALVRLAVEARSDALVRLKPGRDYAEGVRRAFEAMEGSANKELRRAAANADDRLHAARRAEPEIIHGAMADLEALSTAENRSALLALLRRYHRKRIAHARAIRERAVLLALPSNGE